MKVSALNKNIYSNININYASVPIQRKPAERPMEGAIALYSYNPANMIYFTGNNTQKTSPFLKKTVDTLDRTYDRYYESQMITEKEDIQAAVDEIMAETGESEEYVLNAMSQVTQFANYRSVKKIGEALNSEHVFNILGAEEAKGWFHGDYSDPQKAYTIMLPTMLEYLFDRKKLHSYGLADNDNAVAVFLDDDQLNYLEKLKRNKPEDIESITKNPDVKFFIISGFDNGVTFVNRSKDLKTATKNLISNAKESILSLEEAVDIDLVKRAKNLGIEPIIIRNIPDLTEDGIYNNMKPELMSKDDLFNLVDVNTEKRISGINENTILNAKDVTADYLENNLEVFSPERMSSSLLNLHKQILNYAESQGKTEDDIYYYAPKRPKSYNLINYMYKKINGVPIEKFVTINDLSNRSKEMHQGDILVCLDDCTLSGDSVVTMNDELSYYKETKGYDIVFAHIFGTQNAIDFARERTKGKRMILSVRKDEKEKNSGIVAMNKVIGAAGHKKGTTCCVFPYMTPDNNSELASSIALLHNITFRTEEDPNKRRSISKYNIKNRSGVATEVAVRVSARENGEQPNIEIANITDSYSSIAKKSCY